MSQMTFTLPANDVRVCVQVCVTYAASKSKRTSVILLLVRIYRI